jgi:hypothetical protein
MAQASIQITQGALVGGAGQSLLGLTPTGAITLTDSGGAGATSYSWSILTWPSPDASAPTITNATSQVATITPSGSLTDGLYVIRLTRVDGVSGTTVDTRVFGVADADGDHLPSAGASRNLCNFGGSSVAQTFGYQGTAAASSNSLLDSFLRRRRSREGKSKVSATDTTFGRLSDKIVAGTNVTLTVLNSGGNEQIQIASSGGGSTETVISPTSLSGSVNDYSPAGWTTTTHVRLSSSTAVSITGFGTATSPTNRYAVNVGSYDITLAHNSSSSSVGNRILVPGQVDLVLEPGDSIPLWLDSTSGAWRVL